MSLQNFENLNRSALRADKARDALGVTTRVALAVGGFALFLLLVAIDPMGLVVEQVLDARGL